MKILRAGVFKILWLTRMNITVCSDHAHTHKIFTFFRHSKNILYSFVENVNVQNTQMKKRLFGALLIFYMVRLFFCDVQIVVECKLGDAQIFTNAISRFGDQECTLGI